MKKLLLFSIQILIFSSIALSFSVNNTFANTNISSEKNIEYTFSDTGNLHVRYVLVLKNTSKEKVVLSSYRFPIPFTKYTNDSLYIGGSKYSFNKAVNKSSTEISVVIDSHVLNPKQTVNIEYTFNINGYLQTSDEIKSITLPAKTTDIDKTSVLVTYPEYWNNPVKSSANYTIATKSSKTVLTIEDIADNYLELTLGKSLIYTYDISKQYENPEDTYSVYSVNIPLSTTNQNIYFESISPSPDDIETDESGNVILKYLVSPKEKIDINIKAYIELVHENSSQEDISSKYTSRLGYWSITNSGEISRLERYLKTNGYSQYNIEDIKPEQTEDFYKLIYYYIIDRLEPQKKSDLVNYSSRRGIENIILDRNSSSLDDYIDFTIAIYRKLGIPTRMIQGYIAKTDNKTGYYHSWIEYYNEKENSWIKIDPYQEDLLKKTLYGTRLDDRIVILVRDSDPIAPQIQYLNTNEISVTHYNGSVTSFGSLSIESDVSKIDLSEKYSKFNITFKNNSNKIVTIKSIKLYAKENEIQDIIINQLNTIAPNDQYSKEIVIETRDIIYTEDLKMIIEYTDINNNSEKIIETFNIEKVNNPIYPITLAFVLTILIFGIINLIINKRKV